MGCTRSPHFLRGSCPPFSTIFVVSSKNQLKLFSLLLGSCQSRNVLKEHSYVDKKEKKFALSLRVFGRNLFHKSRWWIENLINVWGGEFRSMRSNAFLTLKIGVTLYNVLLRTARKLLEIREKVKISTHPFYHTNLDCFSWEWSIFFLQSKQSKIVW